MTGSSCLAQLALHSRGPASPRSSSIPDVCGSACPSPPVAARDSVLLPEEALRLDGDDEQMT